jgi:hypothetical protein
MLLATAGVARAAAVTTHGMHYSLAWDAYGSRIIYLTALAAVRDRSRCRLCTDRVQRRDLYRISRGRI